MFRVEPSMSAACIRSETNSSELLVENARRFADGRPLKALVDRARCY